MDIIDQVRALALELQKDQRYLVLENARRMNDADEELRAADWRVQSCPDRSETTRSASPKRMPIGSQNSMIRSAKSTATS